MLFVSAGLALVQPGLGRRRLPDRHPRAVAARGDRARVRLRHLDDRRRLRRRAARAGPRQRADQHLAADRRGARPGGALHDRHHAHRRRAWRPAHSTLANGLTEGFQSAFLGGAVIAALGFVATLVLIRTRDSRAHVEMANAEAPGRGRSLARPRYREQRARGLRVARPLSRWSSRRRRRAPGRRTFAAQARRAHQLDRLECRSGLHVEANTVPVLDRGHRALA